MISLGRSRRTRVTRVWICDVNGVLVDSSRVTREAFAATAAHYRCAFTEEQFRAVKGLSLSEAYRLIDPGGEPSSRRDYHLRFVRERVEEVMAFPYVHERLMLARSVGIGIGAATSYGETAEAYLVHTRLYPLIGHLVTADELHRPKPHPDVILMVMRLFDIEPGRHEAAHAVYVGDTAVDIQAGRAAGVTTIGVSYGLCDLREIQAAEPDAIIDSFDEMSRFMAPAVTWHSHEKAATHRTCHPST